MEDNYNPPPQVQYGKSVGYKYQGGILPMTDPYTMADDIIKTLKGEVIVCETQDFIHINNSYGIKNVIYKHVYSTPVLGLISNKIEHQRFRTECGKSIQTICYKAPRASVPSCSIVSYKLPRKKTVRDVSLKTISVSQIIARCNMNTIRRLHTPGRVPSLCSYTRHGKKVPIEYLRIWSFIFSVRDMLPNCLLTHICTEAIELYFLEAEQRIMTPDSESSSYEDGDIYSF